MAKNKVTTLAPQIFTVFFSGGCPFFFHLARVSPGGHFVVWRLKKIEEFERSVCTWKHQLSFLCHFLVLEPLDVNIGN